MNKKNFAWSYSALTSFEGCPHRYFKTRIEKSVPDPMGEAALWGNKVHKALENYLKTREPFPEGMEKYKELADTVISRAAGKSLQAEKKISLNKQLQPTGYFDKDVYLRVITDFNIEHGDKLFIGDWKTGAVKPDSMQLKLSAAAMMEERPWINVVINAFVWLKTGEVTTEKFTRKDLGRIWREFLPRAKRMETMIEAGNFPKKTSGLCRAHCPVVSCEFNGKRTDN